MTDQDICTRKGRGRPKTFDREAALDKALELFWSYGYEATSLSDLVEATGAKAPTLYAEFTNKEGIFRAAVARYIEKYADQRKVALVCAESCMSKAVESYFRLTAASYTDCSKPAGCFLICTSTALSAESTEVADMLRDCHTRQKDDLKKFLLARQQSGELHPQTNIDALCDYLGCLLQGMSVRAREGASRADLDSIIDVLMLQWPTLSQLGI